MFAFRNGIEYNISHMNFQTSSDGRGMQQEDKRRKRWQRANRRKRDYTIR